MNLNVMGREIPLTFAQSKKAYATVAVRPADLRTDRGTFVAYGIVDSTSDSLDRARADLRHVEPGPGAFAFLVRVADSTVLL